MSVTASGEALTPPNPTYRTDLEPELIGLVTDVIDNIMERGAVSRVASCGSTALTQWCEVETVALPGSNQGWAAWNAVANRFSLRHDIIYSGLEAGDVYRLLLEASYLGDNRVSTSRKGVVIYRPDESPDDSLMLQAHLMNPWMDTTTDCGDSIEFDPVLMVFAKQINHDFFACQPMTEFEVGELFDELAFIDAALQKGTDIRML